MWSCLWGKRSLEKVKNLTKVTHQEDYRILTLGSWFVYYSHTMWSLSAFLPLKSLWMLVFSCLANHSLNSIFHPIALKYLAHYLSAMNFQMLIQITTLCWCIHFFKFPRCSHLSLLRTIDIATSPETRQTYHKALFKLLRSLLWEET